MAIVSRVSRSQPNEDLEGFELLPSDFGQIKDIIDVDTDPGNNNEYQVTVQPGNYSGITGINVPSYVNVVVLPGAEFDDGAFTGSTENVVDLNKLAGSNFSLPDDLTVNGNLTVQNNTSSNESTFEKNLRVKETLTVDDNITCNSLTELSRRDLKKDISPLNGELKKIRNLNPVNFTWKENGEKSKGLIAEEVNDVYPEFVTKDEDGNPLGVQYSKLTSVLIEAVQELDKKLQQVTS
jgi:hypothetical protein